MADAELVVVIKAIDELSGEVGKISSNLDSLSKRAESSGGKVASSMDKSKFSFLQLGIAAQNVHNIFESYENAQRRVENAQDRVENATIRLKNAQSSLYDAMAKINDINKTHERDTLSLEHAQINLDKATKNLKDTRRDFARNSIEVREAELGLKDAEFDLTDAQQLGTKQSQELVKAREDISRKNEDLQISQNGLDVATRNYNKVLDDQKWLYLDIGVNAVSLATNTLPKLIEGFTGIEIEMGTIGAAGTAGAGVLGALGLFAYIVGKGIKSDNAVNEIGKVQDAMANLENQANTTAKAIAKAVLQQNLIEDVQESTGTKSTIKNFGAKTYTKPGGSIDIINDNSITTYGRQQAT